MKNKPPVEPFYAPTWHVKKNTKEGTWMVLHPDKPWMILIRKTRADAIATADKANDHERDRRVKFYAADMLDALMNLVSAIDHPFDGCVIAPARNRAAAVIANAMGTTIGSPVGLPER